MAGCNGPPVYGRPRPVDDMPQGSGGRNQCTAFGRDRTRALTQAVQRMCYLNAPADARCYFSIFHLRNIFAMNAYFCPTSGAMTPSSYSLIDTVAGKTGDITTGCRLVRVIHQVHSTSHSLTQQPITCIASASGDALRPRLPAEHLMHGGITLAKDVTWLDALAGTDEAETWLDASVMTDAVDLEDSAPCAAKRACIRTSVGLVEDIINADHTQASTCREESPYEKNEAADAMRPDARAQQRASPSALASQSESTAAADDMIAAILLSLMQQGAVTSEENLPAHGDAGSAQCTVSDRSGLDQVNAVRTWLGAQHGAGFNSIVYEDRYDSRFLIKVLRRDQVIASDCPPRMAVNIYGEDEVETLPVTQRRDAALKEAALFCRFYGADTASVHVDDADVYIRMQRIAGTPLSAVKSLPADAFERLADMMGKLNEAGIMHGDLHGDNVLYDAATMQFKPIDFSDVGPDFFNGDNTKRSQLNKHGEDHWNSLVEQIQSKMRPGRSTRSGRPIR